MSSSTSVQSKPWFRPDWVGPKVERRLDASDADKWPSAAVECISFNGADFPDSEFFGIAPYVEYFGNDGWPLSCPDQLKSRFDPDVKILLHRLPLKVSTWDLAKWLHNCCGNLYGLQKRWAVVRAGLDKAAGGSGVILRPLDPELVKILDEVGDGVYP